MEKQTYNDSGKGENAVKDELISRNELLDKMGWLPLTDEEADGILHCMKIVKELTAVDAVPVVRCKDCRHRGNFSRCPMAHIGSGDPPYDESEDYTIDDGFCNYGEKKDG